MKLATAIGYDRPLIEGRIWFGWLDLFEGRLACAAAQLEPALGLDIDADDWLVDPFFVALGRSILGEVLVAQGRYDDASQQLQLGLADAERHRDPFGEAEVRRGLAWLHYARGELDTAVAQLDRAAGPLGVMDLREASRCLAIRAKVAIASTTLDAARQHARAASTAGRAFA